MSTIARAAARPHPVAPPPLGAGVSVRVTDSEVQWAWVTSDGSEGTRRIDHRDVFGAYLEAVLAFIDEVGERDLLLQVWDHTIRQRLHALNLPQITTCGPGGLSWRAHRLITPPPAVYDTRLNARLLVATDGSRGGHPSLGTASGFAFVTQDGRHEARARRKACDTTVTEIRAVMLALAHLDEPRMHFISDSQAAIRQIERAIARHHAGDAPDNAVLHELVHAVDGRDITLGWVRGHNGNPLNECADRLAVAVRRNLQMGLSADTLRQVQEGILAEHQPGFNGAAMLLARQGIGMPFAGG